MKKEQPKVEEVKRNASFVCKRSDLINAMKTIKGTRKQLFSLTTFFAEQKLIIKIKFFEFPIPCSDCTGDNVSFSLPLVSMRQYCELATDEFYHFTVVDNTLQLNTTFIRI